MFHLLYLARLLTHNTPTYTYTMYVTGRIICSSAIQLDLEYVPCERVYVCVCACGVRLNYTFSY